jgi:3',5'-cyclic AMP phosphodiesterase CpdA
MKTKILHLSDLHIGKSSSELRNLRRIVKGVIERFGKDKLTVMITVDIVHDGREDQYEEARKAFDPLFDNDNFNVWSVPGNHDYGWKGNYAEKKRFKYFKKHFYGSEHIAYPHRDIDEFGNYFVGLNSMKAEVEPDDEYLDNLLANGELGLRQIGDLAGMLNTIVEEIGSDRKKKKIIVHLHHHPFIYPDDTWIEEIFYEKGGHWLKDGQALMGALAGRVDILLFGHEHRHLAFHDTDLSKLYRIPWIFSSAKSTKKSNEYALDKQGKATKVILNTGLLARLIEIDDKGNVSHKTVAF